jgi:MFS family permease
MGPDQLGLLNTVAVLFGVPVPFLSGYVMDRFGRRAVIAPGFGLYAIAVAIMSLTAFFPLPVSFFLFTYVLVQAAAGTTGGTMQVLGSDLSPPQNRGRFFAIWRLFAQLASTAAPAAYAFLAEHAGYGIAFLYLSACAMFVVIAVVGVLGNTMHRADQTDRVAPGSS